MKALFCKNCGDLKMLLPDQKRFCYCKLSFGRYLKNGKARYGGPALLIGIDDLTIENNFRATVTADGPPIVFEAYRIPETSKTVEFVG